MPNIPQIIPLPVWGNLSKYNSFCKSFNNGIKNGDHIDIVNHEDKFKKPTAYVNTFGHSNYIGMFDTGYFCYEEWPFAHNDESAAFCYFVWRIFRENVWEENYQFIRIPNTYLYFFINPKQLLGFQPMPIGGPPYSRVREYTIYYSANSLDSAVAQRVSNIIEHEYGPSIYDYIVNQY